MRKKEKKCKGLQLKEWTTFLLVSRKRTLFYTEQLDPGCWYKFIYLMTYSVDPDLLASSGSTLFAKAGHIRVLRDQA